MAQIQKQGKSEGFDSCDRPSNLKLDSNRRLSACVVIKFDGWPRKTIGHFLYTTSSFVHHFKSIGEVKLELQSGNAQLGSKLVIFFVLCDLEIWCMTSKNNRAPLLYHIKLCIISKPSVNLNWSYSPETLNSGQNRRFFVLCDLEIWRMTWKNNRTPLLCRFKLCASFHSHWQIQMGVRAGNALFGSKSLTFF